MKDSTINKEFAELNGSIENMNACSGVSLSNTSNAKFDEVDGAVENLKTCSLPN